MITVELTPDELRAVLAELDSAGIGELDSNDPLAKAEFKLDSAMLAYEVEQEQS